MLTQHISSILLAPVQLLFQLDVHFSPASKRQLAVRRNRFTSLPLEFPARQRIACWPSRLKRSTPSINREEQLQVKHGHQSYSLPSRRRVKLCRSKNQGGNAFRKQVQEFELEFFKSDPIRLQVHPAPTHSCVGTASNSSTAAQTSRCSSLWNGHAKACVGLAAESASRKSRLPKSEHAVRTNLESGLTILTFKLV